MDDISRLVEKYKRELMEYSKTAPQPKKLDFPEMIAETEEQPAEAGEAGAAGAAIEAMVSQPISAPKIIGYSDNGDAVSSLEKYFADMTEKPAEEQQEFPETPNEPQDIPAEATKATEATEDSPEQDNFTTLPPQFDENPPQNDFTGEAVSPETNFVTDDNEPEQTGEIPPQGELTEGQPGTAEDIGRIPQSGQSPDEQLTGRSFESITPAVNSCDDIKPLEQTVNEDYNSYAPEKEYTSLDEFNKANPRQGTLRFRTYTARNALPVSNADITITKTIDGKRHVFYRLVTDQSGQSEEVLLPAPLSIYSQTPDSGVQPFSLYDADIIAVGYSPVSLRNIPVFEGILSVQRAALVPSVGEAPEQIVEKEPNLTEVNNAR